MGFFVLIAFIGGALRLCSHDMVAFERESTICLVVVLRLPPLGQVECHSGRSHDVLILLLVNQALQVQILRRDVTTTLQCLLIL